MLKHRNKDKGFTLIEIIVTTTIIAMLAAFAVPTFIGYIETGNQTKRMNIAKTIYLAAQNQLTEKKINQTLGAFSMTEEETKAKSVSAKESEPEMTTEYATKFVENINNTLPEKMSVEEKANIVYISKSQGVASGKVYELLDSVIQDKSVLNNAILIEYNKTTGFVLSVFYSEENDGSDESQFAFTYAQANTESKNDFEKYRSLNGGRPYAFADERRQGYCGIEETGMLPPTGKDVIINIKDGKKSPLSDGSGGSYENVLYAEVLIPESMIEGEKTYNLQVFSEDGELLKLLSGTEASKTYETGLISLDKLQNTVDSASKNKLNGNIIFKSIFNEGSKALPEDADNKDYAKIIWVLDYVNGDMLSQNNSIGLKISPQNIRVGISGNGINMKSLSMQNSHFAYETQDKSIVGIEKSKSFITSARHLNNVRYKLDGDFRQLDDIDMKVNSKTEITNFLPIGLNPIRLSDTPVGKFTGKYFGRKSDGTYLIKNMEIDIKEVDNVGLFADIEGKALFGPYTEGIITGLTLENPRIIGRNYVGALAGSNSGQISMVTVENNTKHEEPIIRGIGGIGGIIGENSGVLSKINFVNKNEEKISMIKGAGYEVGGIVGRSSGRLDDIVVISSSSAAVVSGMNIQNTTYTGGVAGLSSAQIDRVMYLAVAPKFITTSGEKISPIVGLKSGTITNAIYLSGEAIRPTPVIEPMDNGYNVIEANFGTPKSTTEINQEPLWNSWTKNAGSNLINMETIYPYPYRLDTPYNEKDTKNWPLVEAVRGNANILYYELYSDGTWGYTGSASEPIRTAESLEKDGKDVTVINDGYCVEYLKTNGTYEITVGGLTLSSTDWKWNDTANTQNIRPVEFSKDVNGKKESNMRLFLNNGVIESQAKSSDEIELKFKKGSMEILSTKFSPLFAPGGNTELNIRSPRQLDNADKASDKDFVQPVNMDFGLYEKTYSNLTVQEKSKIYARELISVDYSKKEYILDLNTKISTTEPIVIGKKQNGNSDSFSDVPFKGNYNGNKKYIKNVIVDGNDALNNGNAFMKVGLFSEISGSVKNVALLESSFSGKRDVGGIAGILNSGGKIELCELSNVKVKEYEAGKGSNIGGIVGTNEGSIDNVYFNSTYRDKTTGVYTSPIIVEGKINVGGLIGLNYGTLNNAYTTAVGPNGKPTIGNDGNKKGTISNVYYLKASGYNSNAVNEPLQGEGKAPGEWDVLLTGSNALEKLMSKWELATLDTTKYTFDCKDKVYPYPKLKGMNHYFDWPILITSLKYYEEYSDGSTGYYYYMDNSKPVDTLKYVPDKTVVEEGYLVDLITTDTYSFRFNGSLTDNLTDRPGTAYDNRRVIKLKPSEVEPFIDSSKITADGILPVKIEASIYDVSKPAEFKNLLFGKDTKGSVYFNPLFAKQIFPMDESEIPTAQKTLELRSPRQMLNVNGREVTIGGSTSESLISNYNMNTFYSYYTPGETSMNANPRITKSGFGNEAVYTRTTVDGNRKAVETIEYKYGYYYYSHNNWQWINRWAWVITNQKNYEITIIQGTSTPIRFDLKQTISINFGGADGRTEIANRPAYKWEESYNSDKAKIANNLIPKLVSNYDAGVYYKDGAYYGNDEVEVLRVTENGGRTERNRIYNLIMNVESKGPAPYAGNTGGAFGTVEESVTVKNLEFVDPQIRYDANGRGGGIVTNINYGTIDNVQVYNQEYRRSLFSDKYGTTGTNSDSNTAFCYSNSSKANGYGHNHGGIAGQSLGKKGTQHVSKITNCIVGTNSNEIKEISEKQKTLIYCHENRGYGNEWATNRVGGIAGLVYGEAEIISCVNISTIDAWYDSSSLNLGSPFSVGGIAGSIGIRNNLSDQSNESFEGGWIPSEISPGHIIGCYNAGSIKLVNGWVAGITGYPAKNSQILSCYNTGRVNIENASDGRLVQTSFSVNQPIRIGGIAGETDGCFIKNSYNIGYLSGSVSNLGNSAAGAIMALPAYSDSRLVNCYSLAADQYRPIGIVGKLYTSNAKVNGFSTNNQLTDNFITWESRANLRNNKELVSDTHLSLFPALNYSYRDYLVGDKKNYPVFTSDSNSFYIYPELTSFIYGGVTYKNPHITPWEYIDAEYDATLKYYEKYNDNSLGYYNLDVKGNAQNNLSEVRTVTEDGYYIEVGKKGKYKVLINDGSFEVNASPISGTDGISYIYITDNMLSTADAGSGYAKIRVHTMLPENTGTAAQKLQNIEDNKLNRLIGSNTYVGAVSGRDIYFDSRFPKEIKYGDINVNESTLKPTIESYVIRSPRHMSNITRLTQAQGQNKSLGRTFVQELDLNFASYGTGSSKPFAGISSAVVSGDFAGIYEGRGKDIVGLKVNGSSVDANIGLFNKISDVGKIENLRLVGPTYKSNLYNGTLNMGAITAENQGAIQSVAVEDPSFTGSNSNIVQNIGGIAGSNSGRIIDAYIVIGNQNGVSPITATGAAANIGGIVGINSGKIDKAIYLAKAPNSSPIAAINSNLEAADNITEAYFLSGTGYNEFDMAGVFGLPATTSQFSALNILDWGNWERQTGKIYPSIQGMKIPLQYPVAEIVTDSKNVIRSNRENLDVAESENLYEVPDLDEIKVESEDKDLESQKTD